MCSRAFFSACVSRFEGTLERLRVFSSFFDFLLFFDDRFFSFRLFFFLSDELEELESELLDMVLVLESRFWTFDLVRELESWCWTADDGKALLPAADDGKVVLRDAASGSARCPSSFCILFVPSMPRVPVVLIATRYVHPNSLCHSLSSGADSSSMRLPSKPLVAHTPIGRKAPPMS